VTHALHDYLSDQLCGLLERRSIVVFYDPRNEFRTFFDEELDTVQPGREGLANFRLFAEQVALARYSGSYFGLRAQVEPIVEQTTPEKLLVYLPGETRDREASVLMELELGGSCYEPQLKRLARHLLQRSFSDAQIDELLNRDGVTYQDIVAFLSQAPTEGPASVLRAIFGNAKSDEILVKWLASNERDEIILEKDAIGELMRLMEVRLGLALPDGASLSEARAKTARYVVVTEFRADLSCEPPTSCAGVPATPSADHESRVRDLAAKVRSDHGDEYAALADGIEKDLGLAGAVLDPACLGAVDTFRFEERRLLEHAAKLIQAKRYGDAAAVVEGRRHSFWADRDVARQAQWEACRLMAELGSAVEKTRSELSRFKGEPAAWVAAYSAAGGWCEADALHRRLETWVARMSDEPEGEEGLAVVKREHEELLKAMAERYTEVLRAAGWVVEGPLPQTRVFAEAVDLSAGRTAYILVDALRYEMGVDLVRQIDAALDVDNSAAVGALPSVTQVGMAALLPGASASFSVVEEKGKLAVRIGDDAMVNVSDRMKHLKAEVPGAVELRLSDVLEFSKAKLVKSIGDAPLVTVRSQELDALGEADSDWLARQLMDAVIGNVVRAVKRLAVAGIERFVITADHGHQFSVRKEGDMKTDSPGGDTVALHRRCWVGRGGAAPPGTVRVSGPQLGYDTDLDFVFPVGLGVFKAGGGLSYHHGGLSLQETVIPVITFRMPTSEAKTASTELAVLIDVLNKVTNRLFPVRFLVQSLLAEESVPVRLLLIHEGLEAGAARMATGAEFDDATGVMRVAVNTEVSAVVMLADDKCPSVKIVLQDVRTDAVLVQSDEIPVKLGV
jgi:hypothetical protein